MKCTFTSVWDCGSTVVTPADYDPETREVSAQAVDVNPQGSLIREFIEFPDGETLKVCPECHEYAMKPVVGDLDHTKTTHGEYLECPGCGHEDSA